MFLGVPFNKLTSRVRRFVLEGFPNVENFCALRFFPGCLRFGYNSLTDANANSGGKI